MFVFRHRTEYLIELLEEYHNYFSFVFFFKAPLFKQHMELHLKYRLSICFLLYVPAVRLLR